MFGQCHNIKALPELLSATKDKMQKYKLMCSHCDDPPECEGSYQFKSDKEAKEFLGKERVKKYRRWDFIFFYRIDQEEKRTTIT